MDIYRGTTLDDLKAFLSRVIVVALLLILVGLIASALVYNATHDTRMPGTEAEFEAHVIASLMLEGYSRQQAEGLLGYAKARAQASGGWPVFKGEERTDVEREQAVVTVFDQRIEELRQEIEKLEDQRRTLQELTVEDLEKFDVVLSGFIEEQQRRSRTFTIVWSLFTTSVGAILGFFLRAYTPPDVLRLIKHSLTD